MILDIYQSIVGQSPVVDRQLLRLQELLEREIDYQQDLLEVLGMLDTMFASSLPRKEVPCCSISRPNGQVEGVASTSRPQLQASWVLKRRGGTTLLWVRVPLQLLMKHQQQIFPDMTGSTYHRSTRHILVQVLREKWQTRWSHCCFNSTWLKTQQTTEHAFMYEDEWM